MEVYRNLHLPGVWFSVRQDGLVVGHTQGVCMVDVTFVTSEAGHARMLATGQRNVHAWLRGKIVPSCMGTTADRKDHPANSEYDRATGRFVFLIPRKPMRGAEGVILNRYGLHSYYTY